MSWHREPFSTLVAHEGWPLMSVLLQLLFLCYFQVGWPAAALENCLEASEAPAGLPCMFWGFHSLTLSLGLFDTALLTSFLPAPDLWTERSVTVCPHETDHPFLVFSTLFLMVSEHHRISNSLYTLNEKSHMRFLKMENTI